MVHCCIIGCKSRTERKDENISFHKFPKHDSAVRQLWIRATGRLNWEPSKYTCICSRHFKQNCFLKTQNVTYLYPSSLPTLHVVELSPAIRSNITTTNIQEVKNPSTASVSEMDTKTFGMPNDMENYMRYHLMGSVSQVRMKPGCLPTKFACQQHLHDRRKRPNILHKKRNMKENKECVKQLKDSDKVTVEVEFEETVSGSTVNHQQVLLKNNGKSNQSHMTRTKQSKANRTEVRLVNQATSPLKPRLNSAATSPFKKNRRVNSKTSKSMKGAPGPSGRTYAGTPLTEPDNLVSNVGLEDPLATEPPHKTPQCRFCAEISEDCVEVTDNDRPYLTRNKTALTLNDLSIELDFNDDALPKTVCRVCDSKLLIMFDFVKQVKEAQDSLINVRDYVVEDDTMVVKTECGSPTPDDNDDDIDRKDDIVDSLTVTETVLIKPNKPIIKHKRKRFECVPKTHKKPKVTEDVESEEAEFIIDIKEETAEMVDIYETENVEYNGTEMDTKPSEIELQTLLKLMK